MNSRTIVVVVIISMLSLGIFACSVLDPDAVYSKSCSIETENDDSYTKPPKKDIGLLFPGNELLLESRFTDSRKLLPFLVEKNISKYDAVWCAQLIPERNYPAWKQLRNRQFNILMLHYMTANSSRPTNESSYYNFSFIEANHPEWFLLQDVRNATNADYIDENKRIRWDFDPKSSYYRRFYLDVGNKEFQDWAADEILMNLEKYRSDGDKYVFDGLGMDNVNVGTTRWKLLRHQYPNFKYANDPEAWHKGFFTYLKRVREKLNNKQYVLVLNHNLNYATDIDDKYWQEILGCADGLMSERALSRKPEKPWYTGANWEKAIEQHEKIIESNVVDWWVVYPGVSSNKDLMYAYCSWLLVMKPGHSLFSARLSRGSSQWHSEYDYALGGPISKKYQLSGCWVRDFEDGKVLVNAYDEPCVVTLGKDGAGLSSRKETVTPRSATIILSGNSTE